MVGLGTWKMTDLSTLDTAIDAAIESGYRHFDCAELYENE
jgi:diketogulonate reductase-like aldo/keto reductase